MSDDVGRASTGPQQPGPAHTDSPQSDVAPEEGAPNGASLDAQVRALREDVAALRDLLSTPRRDRDGAAARQVVATPEHEQIARRLRDDLIRREEELTEARRTMVRLERHLDRVETQRRKMLESRTWRWGKRVAGVGTAPVRIAKSVYGWLLSVLPAPAAQSLRRALASARGREVTRPAAVRRPGGPAAMPSRALVPIPVHGPEGVGAQLTAPAVLLVAYGLDEAELSALVEAVHDARTDVAALRVLIVTDCGAFHVFRARSMLFEYLPPRDEWEKHGFEQSYDEFRALRFTELFRVYAPDRIVHVRSADDFRALPRTLFEAA
jgi:hypothetical protein